MDIAQQSGQPRDHELEGLSQRADLVLARRKESARAEVARRHAIGCANDFSERDRDVPHDEIADGGDDQQAEESPGEGQQYFVAKSLDALRQKLAQGGSRPEFHGEDGVDALAHGRVVVLGTWIDKAVRPQLVK